MGIIIFIFIFIFIFFLNLFYFLKKINNKKEILLSKENITENIFFDFLTSLLCNFCFYKIITNKNLITNKELFFNIFGGLTFIFFLIITIKFFIIFFYKNNLIKKEEEETIGKLLTISPFLSFIGLILFTESFANYINYPLINGINFSLKTFSFSFTTAETMTKSNGILFTFYGLNIIVSAMIIAIVCKKQFIQKFNDIDFDSFVIFIFCVGIIGAKIWSYFVLGKTNDFLGFFSYSKNILNGGLGIVGGIIFGVVFSYFYIKFYYKKHNFLAIADSIIPYVLIIQAIGRFGNFFNQEIYGNIYFEFDKLWWWPTILKKQMLINNLVYLPLFFIEFLTNIIGFFIIYYGIKKNSEKLKIIHGDITCLYFIWYGLTRLILDSLRFYVFRFNENIFTNFIFFIIGILGIFSLHLNNFFLKKINNNKNNEIKLVA